MTASSTAGSAATVARHQPGSRVIVGVVEQQHVVRAADPG